MCRPVPLCQWLEHWWVVPLQFFVKVSKIAS